MLGPIDERTPPMTPQLALRVAIVGGFALVMFAIIFFRLWFLQVLSGSQYVAAAQVNVVRSIPVAAPRGEIVDRNGNPLVESVLVPAIQISPESLPAPVSYTAGNFVSQPAKDYTQIYNPLAKLLRMSTRPISCKFQVFLTNKIKDYDVRLAPIACDVAKGVVASQYANVTIRTNVSPDVQDYIAERATQFPGVLWHDVSVRKYPLGNAGAQVFGTLAQISAQEISQKQKAYAGVKQGSIVGQSGLEYQYNQYLQGIDGADRVKVNSQNQFEGYARNKAPIAGDTLKLSIDANLETVGQQSLRESILKNGGQGGAFIAMDPQNGQIYAMGSAPTYNPSLVSPTISPNEWKFLSNPANNYPLLDRAIQSAGATGSTFKVITATAALESGKWSVDASYDDTGEFCFPGTNPPFCLHNSNHSSAGSISLVPALQISDDVFFYHLGYLMNGNPLAYPKGWPLQQWAQRFGIGKTTGIDLPGEVAGTLPSPAWRAARNRQEEECDKAIGPYRYTDGTATSSKLPIGSAAKGWHRSPKHAPGGCGIANLRPWSIGDNVNTAVGQGDDQVTPLQLAVAYAALANGGTIVTPHLADSIQSPTGTLVQNLSPGPKRHLNIDPSYLSAIQTGLYDAAHAGTSADVMGNFPKPVYGKTGTAQYGTAQQIASNTESDYAWYACFVPATATSKPIVVVVWVPKGGFGDVAAAPVARQILSEWFYGKRGPFVTGTSKTL